MNDCDVFVHVWFDKKDNGKFFDSAQPHQDNRVDYQRSDSIEIIKSLCNPVKIIVEPQRDFSDYTKNFVSAPTARQPQLASLFYGISKCIYLKEQYEKEKYFKYDCVVRARLDLYYEQDIKFQFTAKELEYMYCPAKWQDIRMNDCPGLGDYTMIDCFNFSNSNNMKKFAETYKRLPELNAIIFPPFGENYLGYVVRKIHNIEVKTLPLEVEISQRILSPGMWPK